MSLKTLQSKKTFDPNVELWRKYQQGELSKVYNKDFGNKQYNKDGNYSNNNYNNTNNNNFNKKDKGKFNKGYNKDFNKDYNKEAKD